MNSAERFQRLDAEALNPALNTRPLWLLDIDGVINAFEHPRMQRWSIPGLPVDKEENDRLADTFTDVEQFRVPTSDGSIFTFVTSMTLVREIIRLHRSGLVEIAWLTTWQHDAVDEVSPIFGFPVFPVAATEDGGWEWKTEAAMEALRLRRPIIWTDDDAITLEAETLFSESDVPHLLIAPSPEAGLTPAHMKMIEDFLRRF
jgi:hypothetical protein